MTATPISIVNEDDNESDTEQRASTTHALSSEIDKPSFLSLFTNEYFCGRILVILVTIFLSTLSLSYTIGQALSLEFQTPFCDKKTAEQVAKHSIANNLNEGTSKGCWSTKLFTKDSDLLWTQETYIHDPRPIGFVFAAFLIVTLLFVFLITFYIYTLIIDIKLYRMKKLGKANKHRNILRSHNIINNRSNKSIYQKMYDRVIKRIHNWYNKIFYTDSGWWCIKKIFIEIFEIFIQSIALLYYNGYVLFGSSNGDEDVVLAFKHEYIILFAVFLSMNCIFCCIIWLFYTFKPIVCHGLVFELVLYSTDVLFDIFYTIFPLIVVLQTNNNMLTALASLQKEDPVTFWATFVPLAFLCWSSFSFSKRARNAMSSHYGGIFLSSQLSMRANTGNNNNNPGQIQMTAINSTTTTITGHITYTTNWIISSGKATNHCIRKLVMVIICFLFSGYGIILISLVTTHFNEAITYCSSVMNELNTLEYVDGMGNNTLLLSRNTQNILDTHPELFMWQFCEFPVYPFGSDENNNDPLCQCRQFRATSLDRDEYFVWTVQDLDEYFGVTLVDILTNILLKWYMLEKFDWKFTKTFYRKSKKGTPPPLNMSANMFNARKMRVFALSETPINYIDDKISNWKVLSYLDFSGCNLIKLPDSINQLTELGFMEISENIDFIEFPEGICDMKKMRAIMMEAGKFKSIPHCIKNLNNLQSFILTGNFLLDSIPLELFKMDKLVEFSSIQSNIDINSLMIYNNISSLEEFDQIFEWNPHHNYWFEGAPFCKETVPSNLTTFSDFIDDTDCCAVECDAKSDLDGFQCVSYQFNNGFCDKSCNNDMCHFDGGDCVQLCECDLNELGNGDCNGLCNTTNCLYDGYDCIPLSYDPNTCQDNYEYHGCDVNWVGDGWCDSLCEASFDCGFDNGDCKNCKKNTKCGNIYQIYGLVAFSRTNDDRASLDELIGIWDFGERYNPFKGEGFETPSDVMMKLDINNDEQISLRETIIGLHNVFNLTLEQALQIDCSKCINDYWE